MPGDKTEAGKTSIQNQEENTQSENSEQGEVMAKINIEPFNKGQTQWPRWVKRFESAMTVFQI